ncbi:MAG: sensor histidine kinase [Xylophilus ampelinus]
MQSAAPRLSLARQFLLVSFPIVLATTILIASWVGRQVHESVVQRIGADMAFYVDGFIAPHLGQVEAAGAIDPAGRRALEALMADDDWAERIASLRIWRLDGTVLFSSDGRDVGRRLAIDEGLARAIAGSAHSELSVRDGEAQADHGQPHARMIETYTPIHSAGGSRIAAVAEFYQSPDAVDRLAGAAQRRSWGVVAGVMLATYLLLWVVVRRGSRTIDAQQAALGAQVARLTELDVQNRELHQRVRRAAGEAIVLHEALLQRISASVHDGPCQDLGFALMQIGDMREAGAGTAAADKLDRIGRAVRGAMDDLRAISADLELPDIEPLGLDEVAARVVRDFQAKTRCPVALSSAVAPDARAPVRTKATLYRLLQEALANSFRHAGGAGCTVALRADARALEVEVRDSGPGFDPERALAQRRLGLRGMRQRVDALGGQFAVDSAPGRGTAIRVRLPLAGAAGAAGAASADREDARDADAATEGADA